MWNWSPSVPCVRASQGWLGSCFPSPCAVFCNPLWVENRGYMSPVPGWFDGLQESRQPARAHVGTALRDNHCRPRGLRSISVAFFFLIIYFWLCWVFVAVCFSLGVASRSYSLVAVHGLLTVVAPLVVESTGLELQLLQLPDSRAQAQ